MSPGTDHHPAPRIVDLVFAGRRDRDRGRVAAALFAALAHVGLGVWLLEQGPTLEAWSAELAARVHDELNRVEIVELPRPPEPPPEPAPEPPPVAVVPTPAPPAATPPAPRTRIKIGDPPAAAGKVVSAPPGPVDLTAEVFVEGQGSAYAGGATTPGGTGQDPARSPGAPPTATPPAPPPTSKPDERSRAAAVSLRSEQWSCPWPDDAVDLPLDEQTATIRVTVRADGSVEASEVVQDPGSGFAAAALRCARATRFTPATDADGRPIRAVSPPIRVHFYR